MRILGVVLVLCLVASTARGSEGDSSSFFQTCLQDCQREGRCGQGDSSFLPFLAWTCTQDCKYLCMWEQEGIRRSHGYKRVQYFGKWPFKRLLGVQEPLSTVFSFGNLFFHARALFFRRHLVAPAYMQSPYRQVQLVAMASGVLAWVCSIVFHTRDTWITERLDYNSATATTAAHLLLAISRMAISLAPKWQWNVTISSATLISALLLYHFHYLNFVHFDYTYNVVVAIAIGALQALIWLVWSARQICLIATTPLQRELGWKVVRFQTLLVLASLLETHDFPPIADHLDAHSLWHACTVPLVYYWYTFRELDVKLSKLDAESSN